MNKRNTMQRSLVLEAVNNLSCHATADEVYNIIRQKHPHISRATVYRNLNLLSDLGEIRKLALPGGAYRFDHLDYDHYHARCTKCNKIVDIEMEFIDDLEKNIKNKIGFDLNGHDIIFKGICHECKIKINKN